MGVLAVQILFVSASMLVRHGSHIHPQIFSVAGPAVVIIEGMRGNCISGIPTAYQTLATWNVYPYTNVGLTLPFSGDLSKRSRVKLNGGWPLGGTYSGPG
jgi:hypothetical protein